jgi:diguanylate cyclase (GGDEF)-like protein
MQTISNTSTKTGDFATRALKLMQYLIAVLMASTVVLLLWQHYGMERVIEISATSGNYYEVHDDRSAKGESVGTLKQTPNGLQLHCKLVKSFEYPYCSLWFSLAKEPKGIDLSDFESMSFDIAYTGPGAHMIKVYVRNFDHDAKIENNLTQRVNELEFALSPENTAKIPTGLMHVAAWWVEAQKIKLMNTNVRLDNVTSIEVSTGTYNTPGEHILDVKAIRFHGKWISQNHLLLTLIGLWFTCGVIWPLLRGIQLRAELSNREARLQMMSVLNQALQLETKELSGQAHSDPLTGALNRQGLREALVKQWQSPTPLAETASVIFIDLDYFKKINDLHGHPVGDEVLRRFAAMVQAEIRTTDKLVRWGGEEFLIICPATTAYQAMMLAEKLRLGMGHQLWPSRLDVTASFGVTALVNGEDLGEGIKRADAALYRAKANGRDRVEVLPEIPIPLPRMQKTEALTEV